MHLRNIKWVVHRDTDWSSVTEPCQSLMQFKFSRLLATIIRIALEIRLGRKYYRLTACVDKKKWYRFPEEVPPGTCTFAASQNKNPMIDERSLIRLHRLVRLSPAATIIGVICDGHENRFVDRINGLLYGHYRKRETYWRNGIVMRNSNHNSSCCMPHLDENVWYKS